MSQRSVAQLALEFIGLVVWGYGARVNDERLTLVGIVCFALAVVLRFFKKKLDEPEGPREEP